MDEITREEQLKTKINDYLIWVLFQQKNLVRAVFNTKNLI